MTGAEGAILDPRVETREKEPSGGYPKLPKAGPLFHEKEMELVSFLSHGYFPMSSFPKSRAQDKNLDASSLFRR